MCSVEYVNNPYEREYRNARKEEYLRKAEEQCKGQMQTADIKYK